MFGRRLYLFGLRIHHGPVGIGMVLLAVPVAVLAAPLVAVLLAALGTAATVHDWHDRPWPLRDPEEKPA